MKKLYGAPRLTDEGFSIYLNVLLLEDRIKLLQALNNKYDNRNHDVLILSLQETINKITKSTPPDELLQSLIVE
ncbi:hypothetical protein [Hyunsoonleella jejuensis]|nr:hypothetical protein [Hyunsoonleella jejuensis]